MEIKNIRYMVTQDCFEDDFESEGVVCFCKDIAKAKEVGKKWADYESDPFFTIWENVAPGKWVAIMKGFIPEPEFRWVKEEGFCSFSA